MTSFNDLNLSEPLIKALVEMGFEEATHIQEQAIPVAMELKDVIGQAQTGTGKTAAFGIPIIEMCDSESIAIQSIVITPTRELAVQVAEELNRIGQFKGIRALPIYGGQDYSLQMRGLKNKPHIVVGTPGRLLDHMTRKKSIRVADVRAVVLDEADEMLDMGFIEDIETILSETPETRQTMLFSATMPAPIAKLAKKFMKDPVTISMISKKIAAPDIVQSFLEVHDRQKFDLLCRFLDTQSPDLAIVFGRTKKRVEEIFEGLTKRGYTARSLHGDLDQTRRDSVMRQFKEGNVQVLVATDVAARGLDISGVTHVYNFDIPQDPESYVHRIGRTGRAGKSGLAITFVTPRETRLLRMIEHVSGQRMSRIHPPTIDDAIQGQQRIAIEKLKAVCEEEDVLKYRGLAEMLLDEIDSVILVSAALKMMIKEPDTTPVELTELQTGGKGGSRRSGRPDDRNRREGGDRSSYRDSGYSGRSDRPSYQGDRGQGKPKSKPEGQFKKYSRDNDSDFPASARDKRPSGNFRKKQ